MQTPTAPDRPDAGRHHLAPVREMAGADPVGRAWSRRYDPAARHAVRALADLARLAGIGDTPPPPVGEPPRVPGTHPPAAWAHVAPVGGLVWPDGRADVLRSVAEAWHRSSGVLQRAASSPAVCGAVRARCQTLARAHHSLAAACAGVADDLDLVRVDIAAALTAQGLDARPRDPSAAPHQPWIDYARSGGPVEGATGWRIAAAAGAVRAALAQFARAAEGRARPLTLVGELCADVSRLAAPHGAGRHAAHPAALPAPQLTRTRGAAGRDERTGRPVGTMEA